MEAIYAGLEAGTRTGIPDASVAWLLQNDFILEEALESLKEALPPRFMQRLPRLPGERVRVEVLAESWVDDEPGVPELMSLQGFLSGYQQGHLLTLAELWAIPSFLRLILLERLLDSVEFPDGREVTPAAAASEVPEGPVPDPAAPLPVGPGPFIRALRALGVTDWRDVVESLSRVETILRRDPGRAYASMDFRSRDRYRSQVERIAVRCGTGEFAVAEAACSLAAGHPPKARERHVGYFLIDEGLGELHAALGGRTPMLALPSRRARFSGVLYAAGIVLLTALFLGMGRLLLPAGPLPALLLIGGVIPGLAVAVGLANWIAGHLVSARSLPRMDYRKGIPERARTVVAVPVLLSSPGDIESIIHRLEANFEASRDPALTFALLSDAPDAPEARMPGDQELLHAATREIAELNRRHGTRGRGPFLLLHRARRWNAAENRWMGWERKRGKLSELNQLLLGKPSELWVAEGDPGRLAGVRYVLTLDADTALPQGAAARLVGTLDHPLNRPVSGPGGRIQAGYSVLQPRIELLADPDGGTPFARVYAGVQGLDLYAHAAFDVYQDLFGSAIFAGKGIYDVAAFEASLAGRTPENHLLSHDLFEGEHGRAGLVSDLVLLEDVPGHPLTYARRNHRWIRGDWQLLPWLLPAVPLEGGERGRNPLTPLSRWKILDNLRRSMHAPALLALFLTGWWVLPDPVGWTLFLLGVVGLPFLLDLVGATARAFRQIPSLSDLGVEARALGRSLGRCVLQLAFLPFEAWTAADAIVRTLYRLLVTRTRLLEWATAAALARSFSRDGGPGVMLRKMWPGPAGALLGALGLVATGAPAGALPLGIAFLWLASPMVAWITQRQAEPSAQDPGHFPEHEARRLARRIWGYYEHFQGPEGHWLPPDHFQEDPGGETAFRTSPTNLGMGMVAAVTAWDLGFLDTSRLVARMRVMADGMAALPRHRGHFLNWYDTRRLAPLEPLYVSTVDSGNLAAALIVARQALAEAGSRVFPDPGRLAGIVETLHVLVEVTREAGSEGALDAVAQESEAIIGWLAPRVMTARNAPADPLLTRTVLLELRDRRLGPLMERIMEADSPSVSDWAYHLTNDVAQALGEVELFLPWLSGDASGDPSPDGSAQVDAASLRIHEHALAAAGTPLTLEGLERGHAAASALLEEEIAAGRRAPDDWLARAMADARFLLQTVEEDRGELRELFETWFTDMEFDFLFDRKKGLFHVGSSVASGELDASHYDLLASEARIASAVAMARGEVSSRHWLRLGRPFALPERHAGRRGRGGGPVLLSWSGTMFEYIMPRLFLRSPAETLLDDACRRAVAVQRSDGERRGVPWGISESGYHVLSPEGHYQYRAFGVPALALRRDVEERTVVAPYASLMAVGVAPGAVHRNLARIRAAGGMGPWGPYEALDYGAAARPREVPLVVRSYMSHHHGMILAALGNLLTEDRLVERVHRDPRMAMFEPMLHERIPFRRPLRRRWVGGRERAPVAEGPRAPSEWTVEPTRWPPPVHHLTSGDLVVAMAADGRGGSRWRGWSVLRGWVGAGFRPTSPELTLRDLETGTSWSALGGLDAPGPRDGDAGGFAQGQVIFRPHGAGFVRQTRGIRTRVEVMLPPDTSTEIREIRIANAGAAPRRIRVALGLEVALAPIEDDLRHPAFHKLFVRAEHLADGAGVLFARRPRSRGEEPPKLVVALFDGRSDGKPVRWDVSRERFVGRNAGAGLPAALDHGNEEVPQLPPHHPLDPMAGAVVDLELAPWEEVRLTLVVSVGLDRATILAEASRFEFEGRRSLAREEAADRMRANLQALDAGPDDPRRWESLLSMILHGGRGADASALDFEGSLRQSELWRWGISGDVPYILLEGELAEDTVTVESLLRAQAWWRDRGETVDLVLVDATSGAYMAPVRDRIRTLLARMGHDEFLGKPGGIHLVPGEDLGVEGRSRLKRLAAHVLPLGTPLPSEQALAESAPPPPALVPASTGPAPVAGRPPVGEGCEGRFDPESGAWEILLSAGATTPAPWVNVVARDAFGFLVSESGSGFTWAADAGEFRITPWSNDPILDPSGERIYLRDETTGDVWSPVPGVQGREREHRVRHGWGWSDVHASSDGLDEGVSWSLHPKLDVKVVHLRLRNRGDLPRRIRATFMVDWVMGPHASRTRGRVQGDFDTALEAIIARNPFDVRFPDTSAWIAADRPLAGFTMDRTEFLGPEGQEPHVPPGLHRRLTARPARVDRRACGVIQVEVLIPPGGEEACTFFLGIGDPALALAELREGARPEMGTRLAEAEAPWREVLGRLRVRTPDADLDPLINGWLPYQSISSRLRGRTGFYQSGGALGFRDQLQDAYALLPLDPELAKAQLVAAAGRQFVEGDVLHWWHPQTHRGVRTRCSDNLVWLPWVLKETVAWTGDMGILDLRAPFLTGPVLAKGEDERYDGWAVARSGGTVREGTLWEHALLAVSRSAAHVSPRGLPLMDAHDWNDGMNRVGAEGRGESIWLAWFLHDACDGLRSLAEKRGESDTVHRLTGWMEGLRKAVEEHGWDGSWYRRAYFDDGSPLGSRLSAEARIDAIAQSWAVISGAAEPQRASQAMEAAWDQLVRPEAGVALLLDPPFEGEGPDPGYIAAYPPGVRENGGQYTHAATWLLRALAQMGQAERVGELLRLLLPTRHGGTPEGRARYRVEPYVLAADVYGAEPHIGRGGWTWYTGSAGWLWRVTVEDVLGVSRRGDHLRIRPCIPPSWDGFEIQLEMGEQSVEIRVRNPEGVGTGIRRCLRDGVEVDPERIELGSADGAVLRVEVEMGPPVEPETREITGVAEGRTEAD
ncbi:MAG: hypothetical protein EA350_17430 [Gemmatimonadales bacterium]|nr:MAG: hypothetical protein EA350_17430 [Gemmatimonadales bacterium]